MPRAGCIGASMISSEHLAEFVGVADDLDVALTPPRRSWWFD